MTSRTARLRLVAPAVLAVVALSACSATAGAEEASPGAGHTIEMAVSELCTDAAASECVTVNGDAVVLPTAFDQAGVESASVAEDGQNAIDVTFTAAGAEVLHALTEQAAVAGNTARLVIRIGGELRAAVVVMQALEGDEVQIGLSEENSAPELVELILGR